MTRLRSNFQNGTITDNPLSNSATTINSAAFASLPVVASPDTLAIVLDPFGSAGAPEIVTVTAHTASATSVTVTRGAEGTSARSHANGMTWQHAPTAYDYGYAPIRKNRTSGNLTLNSTSWANVDTGLDISMPADVGDVIEYGVSGFWGSEATAVFLDVVSLVSTPVNSWADDAAPDNTHQGVMGWRGESLAVAPISGSIVRAVVSGDLSSGVLTLRLRYRTNTATNKTLNAQAVAPLTVWAKNHRQ